MYSGTSEKGLSVFKPLKNESLSIKDKNRWSRNVLCLVVPLYMHLCSCMARHMRTLMLKYMCMYDVIYIHVYC